MAAVVQKIFKVDSSSNNIPASFSSAAGSLVYSGARNIKKLVIINEATSALKINFTHGLTLTAPSDADAYVPAAVTGVGPGTLVLEDVKLSPVLYIGSDTGGAISSGIVRGFALGEE